jgi:hypothetical protein
MYAVEMASGGMIYIPSFMKIDTGVQAIRNVFLSNFRGCNVGIADGRDLCGTPLRWSQVAWCTYKVS